MAENSGAGKDTSAFKVSWALNVWQIGVKHSRAERSNPLCQPIGNELGAWPTSHDSVFYGARWRMTSSVPEHNLGQINKNKEEKDQENNIKKEKSLITQTEKVIRKTSGIVGGGGFKRMKERVVLLL